MSKKTDKDTQPSSNLIKEEVGVPQAKAFKRKSRSRSSFNKASTSGRGSASIDKVSETNTNTSGAKTIGVAKIGTSQGLHNGLSSMAGIAAIEQNGRFINVSGKYDVVRTISNFDDKELTKSLLTRSSVYGKDVRAKLPTTITSGRVIIDQDEVGQTIDRLFSTGLATPFGLNPDIVHSTLTLNLSGYIPQTSDILVSGINEDDEVTNASVTTNQLSFYVYQALHNIPHTSDEHNLVYNAIPTTNYTQTIGKLHYNVPGNIANGAYNADISSVIYRNNLKRSFNNLLEFYRNNAEYRLHQLMDRPQVFRSLIEDPILVATFLYIYVDALKGALSNAEVIIQKHGVLDFGTRYLLTRNSSERKNIDRFVTEINKFLKQVPVNTHVIDEWEKFKNIGTLSSNHVLEEDNPLFVPLFRIARVHSNVPMFNFNNADTRYDMRSSVAQASVRGDYSSLFGALMNQVREYVRSYHMDHNPALFRTQMPVTLHGSNQTFNKRTDPSRTKIEATISYGRTTQFMLNFLITELTTGQISNYLNRYSLRTLSFWDHLKLGNVFEGTNFKFLQHENIDINKSVQLSDIKQTSYIEMLSSPLLDLEQRRIPIFSVEQLNNVALQKTVNVHVYSKVPEVVIPTHTKFLVASGIQPNNVLASNLTSVHLMSSVIIPWQDGHELSRFSSDGLVMANYQVGDWVTFSQGVDQTLTYLPVGFLWCGVHNKLVERINYTRITPAQMNVPVPNRIENRVRPSGTQGGGTQYVSTTDYYFFSLHFDHLINMANAEFINAVHDPNRGLVPLIFYPYRRSEGIKTVLAMSNDYTHSLFNIHDISDYYNVPETDISEKDIKF